MNEAKLHPNGFLVRLLANLPFGMRLRLHVWPEGTPRADNPHDHRGWFVSLPLRGRFRERRYTESDRGLDYSVLRCGTSAGNGSPKSSPEGGGRLELVSERVRRALMPYFCPAGAVHSFIPDPGPAASIVLFGPPLKVPRVWVR